RGCGWCWRDSRSAWPGRSASIASGRVCSTRLHRPIRSRTSPSRSDWVSSPRRLVWCPRGVRRRSTRWSPCAAPREKKESSMKKTTAIAALAFCAAALPLLAIGPKDSGQRNLAILIFPGVQIIDYTGPWEVFGHARVDDQRAFRIYTVAPSTGPITTSMGMSVNPEFTFSNAPKADVLVIPGGNVNPQLDNAELLRWVRSSAASAQVVLSVCNGAFFLAKAGLLDGLEATTFAGLIDQLRTAAPKTRVVTDKRYVDNHNTL